LEQKAKDLLHLDWILLILPGIIRFAFICRNLAKIPRWNAALVRNNTLEISFRPKLGLKSLTANAPKKRDWRDRVAAV